jgi:hypothetical protein
VLVRARDRQRHADEVRGIPKCRRAYLGDEEGRMSALLQVKASRRLRRSQVLFGIDLDISPGEVPRCWAATAWARPPRAA